jgi:hypothetical protein
MLFVFLLNANLEESNECSNTSTSFCRCCGWHESVMNDKHLKVKVMGQQVSVENVVPLFTNEIVEEEEVQANEDVGERWRCWGNI